MADSEIRPLEVNPLTDHVLRLARLLRDSAPGGVALNPVSGMHNALAALIGSTPESVESYLTGTRDPFRAGQQSMIPVMDRNDARMVMDGVGLIPSMPAGGAATPLSLLRKVPDIAPLADSGRAESLARALLEVQKPVTRPVEVTLDALGGPRLTDGRHLRAAAEQVGLDALPVEVVKGSRRYTGDKADNELVKALLGSGPAWKRGKQDMYLAGDLSPRASAQRAQAIDEQVMWRVVDPADPQRVTIITDPFQAKSHMDAGWSVREATPQDKRTFYDSSQYVTGNKIKQADPSMYGQTHHTDGTPIQWSAEDPIDPRYHWRDYVSKETTGPDLLELFKMAPQDGSFARWLKQVTNPGELAAIQKRVPRIEE